MLSGSTWQLHEMLCPVGTLSENLYKLGRRIFGRNVRLPRWADIALRGLKYLLLGFFVVVIGGMSTEMLAGVSSIAHDLAVVVDVVGDLEFPIRASGNEGIQVHHRSVLVKKRAGLPARVQGDADDLAEIINRDRFAVGPTERS